MRAVRNRASFFAFVALAASLLALGWAAPARATLVAQEVKFYFDELSATGITSTGDGTITKLVGQEWQFRGINGTAKSFWVLIDSGSIVFDDSGKTVLITFEIDSTTYQVHGQWSAFSQPGYGAIWDGITLTDLDVLNSAMPKDWTIGSAYYEGSVALSGSSSSPVSAGTARFSEVPIPAAVWLFGSGLIGLVAVRRRKPETKPEK